MYNPQMLCLHALQLRRGYHSSKHGKKVRNQKPKTSMYLFNFTYMSSIDDAVWGLIVYMNWFSLWRNDNCRNHCWLQFKIKQQIIKRSFGIVGIWDYKSCSELKSCWLLFRDISFTWSFHLHTFDHSLLPWTWERVIKIFFIRWGTKRQYVPIANCCDNVFILLH